MVGAIKINRLFITEWLFEITMGNSIKVYDKKCEVFTLIE